MNKIIEIIRNNLVNSGYNFLILNLIIFIILHFVTSFLKIHVTDLWRFQLNIVIWIIFIILNLFNEYKTIFSKGISENFIEITLFVITIHSSIALVFYNLSIFFDLFKLIGLSTALVFLLIPIHLFQYRRSVRIVGARGGFVPLQGSGLLRSAPTMRDAKGQGAAYKQVAKAEDLERPASVDWSSIKRPDRDE